MRLRLQRWERLGRLGTGLRQCLGQSAGTRKSTRLWERPTTLRLRLFCLARTTRVWTGGLWG